MKPQDIAFFFLFLFLLYKKNPRWATVAGLISLILAIPLFALWVFFTAEHLTWYAAGFFLLVILLFLLKKEKLYNKTR